MKRILWLLNHTSARKVEVPLLLELGYEVFCPKSFSYESGDYSASVTYEYDASLSIPEKDLERLNRIDFYESFSADDMELMNQYFDGIIVAPYSTNILQLVKRFHGIIIFRLFSLLANEYTQILFSIDKHLLTYISRSIDRIFFATAYNNLFDEESSILKNRELVLPLPLKDAQPMRRWVGGDGQFLFVCPKIRSNPYYEEIYETFKKDFGDLPHVIGGAQPIPVTNDPHVAGFLPNKAYEYNMTHLAAMYYHSQAPHHLHYHPLEAVRIGMPLVFMGGGMLDHLGGKSLPGRAATVHEAHKKLEHLLNGDRSFIRAVTESQEVLLQPFTMEHCRPYWQRGFQQIEEKAREVITVESRVASARKKRVAVVLPMAYLGGVLDYAERFLLAVQSEIDRRGTDMELVFYHPDSELYHHRDVFSKIRHAGIPVRSFVVEGKSPEWVSEVYSLRGWQPENGKLPAYQPVCVLRDGMNNLEDCDFAIFLSDAFASGHPLFCLVPYAMVVHDYIQCYVPESVPYDVDQLKRRNQMHAEWILTTSEPTRQDAIHYAGLDEEKVLLTPQLFDVQDEVDLSSPTEEEKGYFLWSTNAAPHKNHETALRAIERYYSIGGSLECMVTGVNSRSLSPDVELPSTGILTSYVTRIREVVDSSSVLKEHLHFMGNLSKPTYLRLLHGASFIFCPGYGDNGNFSVLDAAALGVPALSADYPAAHYLADFAEVSCHYADPFAMEEMADRLLAMEKNCKECAELLPTREQLQQKSYMSQAGKLYDIVERIVGMQRITS